MLVLVAYYNYIYSSNKWTEIRRVHLSLNEQLLFGEEISTLIFGPLNGGTIISRGISTVPLHLNFQIRLSYTLITASSPGCPNADSAFTALLPRLEYRVNGSQSWTIIEPGKLLNIV